MQGLKILHVIPNLLKGGAQRLVIDICNELLNHNGVKVKLIVFEDKNEFSHITENIDIEICPAKLIPSVLRKDYIDISNYEKVVDTFKPDIIHSHLYLAEIISRENVRTNIIYFTHCHDNIFQFENFKWNTLLSKNKLTNFYERLRIIPKYICAKNNFIAVSKDTVSYLNKVLPRTLRKNIILSLNGVNIKAFSNPKYNKPSEKIKLISVGNLIDKKNQIFLLQVAKYLKEKKNIFNLKIIGDGENKQLLSNEIKRLSLENEVQLLGAVDDVQQHLWESNIFVHSALYEPFGLVLIEAMAAGLPVICFDGKGNLDIICPERNGFLVRERKPEVFAKKILQLAIDEKLHRNMSEFSKQFSEQFGINIYTNKLLLLYIEKLKRK